MLSVPIRLRYQIAFDRELCRRVRNVFVRAVLGFLRRRGQDAGERFPEVGAVTAVQRFGGGEFRFAPFESPDEEDLRRMVSRIRSRVSSLLRLDRVLELDRGAGEFSHVRLAVTGEATPGGSLTITSTGTPSALTRLFFGVGAGETAIPHFGALFVDLTSPYELLPWAEVPSTIVVDLPADLPIPATYFAQQATFLGDAGNLSDVVRVDVE